MQANHHQQCILSFMKVHCLYPASPPLSCRKERHFAACLMTCGGIVAAFIVILRHHVLSSHLEPINHEKLYNPFSGCHQLILSSVKYRVDPQTCSSAISWIHLALVLLWLSLSEKWRGFFHWLLPLQKFRQDLKEWIRTNRTEERLCQSKRRQDPAEEMANIHRGGYELKNLK